MRRRAPRAGALCLLAATAVVLAPVASAGTVLRWSEVKREGRATSEARMVVYGSEEGLRIELAALGGKGERITILYLAEPKALYLKERDAREWVVFTPEQIEAKRKPVKGKRRPEPKPAISRTGTRHVVGDFECDGYVVKRKGEANRMLCLADPAAIGLDATVREHFREWNRLMNALAEAGAAAKPSPAVGGVPVRFFDLKEGFPVREWVKSGEEVVLDTKLEEVASSDVPASIFQPPPVAR